MGPDMQAQPEGIAPRAAYEPVFTWYLRRFPGSEASGAMPTAPPRLRISSVCPRLPRRCPSRSGMHSRRLSRGFSSGDITRRMVVSRWPRTRRQLRDTAGRSYWLSEEERLQFERTSLGRCWAKELEKPAALERELTDAVVEELVAGGFDVAREPSFAGTRPDLVARNAEGQVVVVEIEVAGGDSGGSNAGAPWNRYAYTATRWGLMRL